jgi:hypothetical protein
VLSGITGYPTLAGYVATTAKPTATVGLTSPEQDPILAQWQYGLGRAVAFTSDASARWSAAWASWGDFSRFWSQVFKWTVPAPESQSLQVQTTLVGDQAKIVVDSIGADGRYVNDAPTTATIAMPPDPSHPGAGPPTLTLTQSAPGRYTGTVTADRQGNYLVQVSQSLPGQSAPATQVHGFTVPYSPEFAELPTNYSLLRELTRDTGGAVLTQPSQAFAHDLRLADSAQPIWPLLIAALVPLFLLDVAVRRVRFDLADLRPAVNWVRKRWVGQSTRASQLAARLAASRRAADLTSPAPSRPLLRPMARHAPPPVGPIAPRPAPRTVPSVAPASTSGPTGSRLLAAKRRATPTNTGSR